ncbi:putative uncharacterized protein precursor [Sphingomonas paucimobilis]|nr:putative uncharacterized protein precursor [Sphingomonas paucimobilis]
MSMRGITPQWKAKIMLKKIMLAGLMSATILGGVAPAYAQRGDDGGWRGRAEQRARPDTGRAGGDGQRWQRSDAGQQQGQAQRWQQRREGWQQQQQPQRRDDRPSGRVEQSGAQGRWQQSGVRGDDGRRDDGRRDEGRRNDASRWNRQQGWGEASRQRDDRQGWRESRREDRRDGWRGNDGWNNDDRRWRGNNGVDRRFDDRTRWNGQRRWDSGWRQDRRYDWRSYRSRYGDRYRIGRYYAPRGWSYGYRRYSTGIFLNSVLFTNSYWIDDPWSYRLPPAYGTLRWIRYYDDALLVDIRDGYVVDVIHEFFW